MKYLCRKRGPVYERSLTQLAEGTPNITLNSHFKSSQFIPSEKAVCYAVAVFQVHK
jgi:hypothetical protein